MPEQAGVLVGGSVSTEIPTIQYLPVCFRAVIRSSLVILTGRIPHLLIGTPVSILRDRFLKMHLRVLITLT